MTEEQYEGRISPALTKALADKGYAQLTAVQEAVLDPALAGRDLRITSQTGSGKTLAIGFALRELVKEPNQGKSGLAQPRALVVAPTRELAQQVEHELAWLYAHEPGSVASTTGGASYRDEHRALAAGPAIVVGTPGRLLDHLTPRRHRRLAARRHRARRSRSHARPRLPRGPRGDPRLRASRAPHAPGIGDVPARRAARSRTACRRIRRTSRARAWASANADIDHVIHLVDPRQRLDAIVNLLLRHPDEQTLVFVRMRADVARDRATSSQAAGFAVGLALGRDGSARATARWPRFKRGDLKVLVATDVAARGIDVQDIARVIHAEPPTNADAYTHRSGRTGRAGRKGTSCLLVSPRSSCMRRACCARRASSIASSPSPAPTRFAKPAKTVCWPS